MGQRAHDGLGISRTLPLDFIISCDYGTDTPLYFREEDVFSVEKQRGIRKDWSNEDLNESFKGALGREIFEYLNSFKRPVNILCYRSVKKLETDGSSLASKPRIFAMPERLKKHFDNKLLLHRNLERLSLPKIKGKAEKLGKMTFRRLREELALPFVIQFPYGSSGNFTFVIREEREYNRLRKKYPRQIVTMRKYIDGYSMNGNAVIVSTGEGPAVHCAFPSVQITGRPECGNFPSAFCGNDFSSARSLPKNIIKKVGENMRAIGSWMAEAGFRGIFGMDFVVKDDVVYPVEINPRFQNSTGLYTSLERMQHSKEGKLFLLHIAEFLQKDDKLMRKYIKDFPFDELMRPLKGSQVILHNRPRRNIVRGDLKPGIYQREGRKFVLKKESALISDCRGPEDVLVTCGVPRSYSVIEPNASICKIQMLREALEPEKKRKLSADVSRIISRVYNKLSLKSASEMRMAEVR